MLPVPEEDEEVDDDFNAGDICRRPASSVVRLTLSVWEVWDSIPGPVKSALCRQRLVTAAMFLRSCVAQALSRGNEPLLVICFGVIISFSTCKRYLQ